MKFTLMLLLALPFAAMAQEDPEAVYSKMHKALLASNVDEALKYSTEARRKELSSLPQAQKVATVQLIAKMLPQTYSIAGTSIAPDGKTAELRASGQAPALMGGKPETNYGVILFVKEKNEWKVDKSEWSNTRPGNFGLVMAQAKPGAAAPAAAAKGEMSAAEAQRMLTQKDEEVQMSEEQIKKAREEEEALARKKAAEDAAAERERQKQARMALCVIKPVMTDEEIDLCRVAYKD